MTTDPQFGVSEPKVPSGTCLVCGRDGTFGVWSCEASNIVGACEQCRDAGHLAQSLATQQIFRIEVTREEFLLLPLSVRRRSLSAQEDCMLAMLAKREESE